MWKELPVDPRYLVSEDGQIKGLDGRLLKQAKDTRGYLFVTLNNNYQQYHLSMHRAVALCYIPNPHNYPQVNHKDEDKTNNHYTNLEWCDNRYNSHYSHSKAVLMIDKDTNKVIKRFEAVRDVDEYFGAKAHQSVSKCCLHRPRYYSAYGYRWEFEDELVEVKRGELLEHPLTEDNQQPSLESKDSLKVQRLTPETTNVEYNGDTSTPHLIDCISNTGEDIVRAY
jgi:hypothetical protein